MFKKLAVLGFMLFALASAALPCGPLPGCYPCGGQPHSVQQK